MNRKVTIIVTVTGSHRPAVEQAADRVRMEALKRLHRLPGVVSVQAESEETE